MKSKFAEYLVSIGMSQPLQGRVESVLDFYEKHVLKLDVHAIFASEQFNPDGSTRFSSLWCFAPKTFMEAFEFASTDKFDFTRLPIERWELEKFRFDLSQPPTSDSRLTISISFRSSTAIQGNLVATGHNCTALAKVFADYIQPNVI